MATILRGKDKGKTVKISQWCNDWVTLDPDNKVVSPTSLQYTIEELQEIVEDKSNGFMLTLYRPDWTTLRLVRRKK